MSKNNRVSVNQFKSLLYRDEPVEVTIHGRSDLTVKVRRNISFEEMAGLVNSIADTCIDVNTGSYHPELYDIALRSGILRYYAGFTMPDNAEQHYKLLYQTEAFNSVLKAINPEQVEHIESSILEKMEFAMNIITSTAMMRVTDMIESMNKSIESIQKVFEGVSPEQIASVFRAVNSDKEVTEEGLVKTILKLKKEEQEEQDE